MESEGCRRIGAALQERGHRVKTFLANGQKPTFTESEVGEAVKEADFVLLAVSENLTETLRAGAIAKECGIPFGIYASGGPNGYRGSNLAPLRSDTGLVFVFNESEVGPTQTLFPKAKVVVTGSLHWENFFFPALSREEARTKLGVAKDELVILVPGDKDLVLNILLFGLTIEAAGELASDLGRHVRVVIGFHPRDLNPISAYQNLGRFVPPNVSVTFLRREAATNIPGGMDLRVQPTPHALSGADIVVTFVSTLGYEAACQRIPVVCFFPLYGEKWLESLTGTSEWKQCGNGTAREVRGCSAENLAEEMLSILTPGPEQKRLRQKQEMVYPNPPEKGAAVRSIVEALENFRG